jgi:hypothetical protein
MELQTTTTPRPKPQKLEWIGILMLVSGAINICAGVGLVLGLALSIVLICCAPLGALPLALGIFEVIYGIRLIGASGEPIERPTLQTIAILEVVALLFSNLISGVIGIVNLVLLSDSEVTGYFRS